ncbi:hypothetical protein PPL_02586 [Heterostelium album PN500]|uniref:WAP domain-containing protein n=1 Tax=Heterostelium pallidum (strain ATCC 26659 / Pp 5 / PN500) TaxID=670386 RepID=D3B2H3_HETP5|nr:hypothetical protein PPL_02586 [Heterostelium album PN500]EFA83521.1 hypothetical protein PPL_02586 [Heterostelium album PN500]|eukprot:XP_020435638.1 hypothetical protein PPL_02586 [Heterostelium album PN500]
MNTIKIFCFLFIFSFLTIGIVRGETDRVDRTEGLVCPSHVGPPACVIACEDDSSCNPGYLCCGNGCGQVCKKGVPVQ